MYCRVLNWMSTDVSEVHAASIIRAISDLSYLCQKCMFLLYFGYLILPMLSGSLVTTAWRVLRLWISRYGG
jgi:hypothetical protein